MSNVKKKQKINSSYSSASSPASFTVPNVGGIGESPFVLDETVRVSTIEVSNGPPYADNIRTQSPDAKTKYSSSSLSTDVEKNGKRYDSSVESVSGKLEGKHFTVTNKDMKITSNERPRMNIIVPAVIPSYFLYDVKYPIKQTTILGRVNNKLLKNLIMQKMYGQMMYKNHFKDTTFVELYNNHLIGTMSIWRYLCTPFLERYRERSLSLKSQFDFVATGILDIYSGVYDFKVFPIGLLNTEYVESYVCGFSRKNQNAIFVREMSTCTSFEVVVRPVKNTAKYKIVTRFEKESGQVLNYCFGNFNGKDDSSENDVEIIL